MSSAKITQERITVIVASIERGDYKITAAALAGIHRQTLDNWLTRGEAEATDPIDPSHHTKAVLTDMAVERGVDLKGTRNKTQIASRLNQHRSLYLDLFDAYTRAFAEAETVALGQAVRVGKDDWRFWMTYLERTRPQRWGRRDRLDDETLDDVVGGGDEKEAQRRLERATEIRIKMLGTGTDN